MCTSYYIEDTQYSNHITPLLVIEMGSSEKGRSARTFEIRAAEACQVMLETRRVKRREQFL
jgi:hypothetical protein